jgi:hypothetical protein
MPLKKKRVPKHKVKVNSLNFSDNVNILDLWKGNMSLAEVGQHYGKTNQAPAVQH